MAKAASPSPDTPPRAAERILTTARELFYREGARAVGVDEIVTRAGTTKPSLYRAFGSKDRLIAAYMDGEADAVTRAIEAAVDRHAGDARAQLLAVVDVLARPTAGSRGCPLSNALVEYPDRKHPGRKSGVAHKSEVRDRLRSLARALGARKPKKLADGLMLLAEGAQITRQIFADDGPADAARAAAEALIEAHTRDPEKDDA